MPEDTKDSLITEEHPLSMEAMEACIRRQIEYIGDNPEREGLKDTPGRVLRSWNKLFGGYLELPEKILATYFEDESYQQIVLLKDVEVYSTCEHHLLPFFGAAHVAYIPEKKVVGISKLARLLECYTRRLQIQERICLQVVDAIEKYLQPKAAACILKCVHFCMTSRGVEKQKSKMVTSAISGSFEQSGPARQELFTLINSNT